MNVTKVVAKLRLVYHLNMIDFCNVANQLHLLSDKKADQANKNHCKQCFDCYNRLGYKLPKEIMEFVNEK